MFSVGEVVSNPGDALSWIGLVGDIVDLVPFISGAGETAKAIGVSVRITNKVDNTCDVINVAKATDFTEDAWDVIKSLDKVDGATKSTLQAGQIIHKGYKKQIIFLIWQKNTKKLVAFAQIILMRLRVFYMN